MIFIRFICNFWRAWGDWDLFRWELGPYEYGMKQYSRTRRLVPFWRALKRYSISCWTYARLGQWRGRKLKAVDPKRRLTK